MFTKRSATILITLLIGWLSPDSGYCKPTAAATSKVKIFKGTYQGTCMMDALDGTQLFYIPVRFTINSKGALSGTALKLNADATEELVTLSGTLGKVRKYALLLQTKTSSTIKFSDGAIVKARFAHNDIPGLDRLLQVELVGASMQLGDYLGDCAILRRK